MGYIELPPAKAKEAMKRIGDQLRSRGRSYTVGLRELVGAGFPANNITARLVNLGAVETQGPLILSRVLIERFTVVQRPVVANFRPDQ